MSPIAHHMFRLFQLCSGYRNSRNSRDVAAFSQLSDVLAGIRDWLLFRLFQWNRHCALYFKYGVFSAIFSA